MPRQLEAKEIDWVLDDVFSGVQIDQTLKKIGFTRREFNSYLKANPEFREQFDKAMLDACPFLENDLLNIYKRVDDAKLARVALESINKILVFRDPAKYSQKLDISMNQTISIRSNLDASTKRIEGLIKDAQPIALEPAQLVSFDLPSITP